MVSNATHQKDYSMTMTITGLLQSRGKPIEQQRFTWKEFVGKPISKLDDDAFTRVRIILMNGVEADAIRLKHMIARCNRELREPLALIRRIEHHQQTLINWLLSPDHSPLETTIAYEQVAIEVTAAVAKNEPDPYQRQTYRFGLLEDFDHLYRYSAMLDRLEGKDANNILQSYTDIIPGRITSDEHRAPIDDIRNSYNKHQAELITKIHAALITAAEYQTHDYYMNIGPTFTDPLARELYAEIASVEEQHVTQYGSLIDPEETFIEKLLIHEAMEVYTYFSCVEQETNPRIRDVWERFLDYELGQLNLISELFKKHEQRDPEEILATKLPRQIEFKSQRGYIREVLAAELGLRANGKEYVKTGEESQETLDYREHMNSQGNASSIVSAGYQWCPGTELRLENVKGEVI